MPKNKKGGKKFKRGKNTTADERAVKNVRMIEDKLERYARVKSAMGDRRLAVETSMGETIVAHIPGKFRKRVWISAGDIILISLRPFDLNTGDVLSKYSPQEARFLIRKDEIKDTFVGSATNDGDNGEEEGLNISWRSAPQAQQSVEGRKNDDYYADFDLPPSSSEYSDDEEDVVQRKTKPIANTADDDEAEDGDWQAMLDKL